MPILQVALDARPAKAGSDQFATAAAQVTAKAKEIDKAIAGADKAVKDYSNTLYGQIKASSQFNAVLDENTRLIRGQTGAVRLQNISATDAKTAFEGMVGAVNDSIVAQKAATQAVQATNATQKESAKILQDSRTQLQVSTQQVENYHTAWSRAGDVVKTVTRLLLGLSGGVAAIMALRGTVSTIEEFEKQIARLQGVTQGTTAEMAQLTTTARNFGATTMFTATQSAEGLLLLSQAGFSVKQSIEGLPGVLSLAAAGVIDLNQSASIVSNTINQFGLATSSATRISDIFINTGNKTNTTVLQLAEAMEYVGPVAAAFNASLEETAAAIGVLSNRGIQASIAGTNLRSILAALAAPTKQAQDILKQLGVTVEEVNPATHSLTEIFQRFRSAGLDAAAATELFNRRNGAAALVLTAAVGEMQKLTEANFQSAGAAKYNADAVGSSLYGSFQKVRAIIQEVALSTGDQGFSGILRSSSNQIIQVSRYMLGLSQAGESTSATTKVLAGSVQFLALALTGLATMKTAAFLWSLLPPMVAGAGAAYNLGRAFGFLYASIGPGGWVVLGISAVIAAATYLQSEMEETAQATRKLRVETENLATQMDNFKRIGSESQFARDTKDIEAQLVAAQKLRSFYRETIIDMQSRVDKGSGTVEISELMKIIQSDEGKDAVRRARQAIVNSFVREGQVDWSAMFASPFYGLSREAEEFNKEQRERLKTLPPGSTTGPLRTGEIFALPSTTALKILREEFEKAGVAADEMRVKAQEAARAFAMGQSSAISKEAIEKLKEEQALAALTDSQKRGELAVREAVKAAKQINIDLTEKDIALIREEGERTYDIIEAEKIRAGWKEKATRELEKENQLREHGIDALDELIARLQDENALLESGARSRNEGTAVLQAEAIARKAGLSDISAYVDKIRELQAQQKAFKAEADRRDGVQQIEQYIANLRGETDALRVSTDERAAYAATLKIEAIAREKGIVDIDAYIEAVKREIAAQQQVKASRDREEKQAKGQSIVDQKLRDLDNELALIGVVNEERDRSKELTEFQRAAEAAYGDEVERVQGLLSMYSDKLRQLDRAKQLQALFDDVGKAAGDAFTDIVLGAESAEDAVRGMMEAIIRMTVEQMAARPLANLLSSLMGSITGSLIGAFSGGGGGGSGIPAAPTLPSGPTAYAAMGGVYGGGLEYFANGGVASYPTLFPMGRGRMGVYGEQGKPEVAIAPLSRMPDGRLGVATSGSGQTVIVNIHGVSNTDDFRRNRSAIVADMRRALRG